MNYESRMAQQDFEGKKSFDTCILQKKYMVTQIKLTIFNCRVECMEFWKITSCKKMTI